MKRIFSGIGTLLVLCAAAAPYARAATIGGFAGAPNGGSAKASCFSDGGWNTVINNGSCGNDAGSWEVPLYTNAAGAWSVNVTVPACGQPVTCAAYSIGSDGTRQPGEAFANVPANTSGMYPLAGTANVPDGGFLFAACWLPPSCKLASVNWHQ